MANNVLLRDDTSFDESQAYYKVRIVKAWFRGKDVFTNRLHYYEKQLLKEDTVYMPLDAGNMIYTMMHRLEIGVEWEKQAALMASYRNLVYRLSYTNVSWSKSDINYVLMEGQKSDVMWAMSFITQVFFEEPMHCVTVPMASDSQAIAFAIQNGEYVGKNAVVESQENALPDIWVTDAQTADAGMEYDPHFEPMSGDMFAIPDGRIAQYVRMDERFYLAKTQGANVPSVVRHNISASLIKDFEDLIYSQTKMARDLYELRYSAFMSKVHELEYMLGGLEPTAYDVIPIAERGIPVADVDTVSRTNIMQAGSLEYFYNMLKKESLKRKEKQQIGQLAIRSLAFRQRGYETEYRMYLATGSSEEAAAAVYRKMISKFYADFAKLDALNVLAFPQSVYRDLCNVPRSGGAILTDWERQRIRLFGKGYLDFLNHQIKMSQNKKKAKVWVDAKHLLDERYMKNPNRR